MKAYVIKNKEGEYLDECQDFSDGLYNARLFTDIDEISLFIQKDCRVVEITIAEGDLEQQLEEKDKEIDTLRKTLVRISNEKARIIDGQNIDYLSFAIQLRHEICEDIMNKIDEKFNCCGYIEEIKFEDFKKILLDQIEGEEVEE